MDVVSVGLSDGRAVLHNIRYDEKIVEFKQDWGPVTTLTFRTGTTCFSNYSRNVNDLFAVTGSKTVKETREELVVWNCVEVSILHRDRHAHRFPLGSVLI